jgi:hypothetical protein
MAIDKTYLEWYPAAKQVFKIGFGAMAELIAAETHLDEDGDTPVVQFHQLTVERPETWVDKSTDVTIGGIGVVDDDVNGMEFGAVQFTLSDSAPPPSPGDTYSFFVMADRADDPSLQVATRVWVRVMP